MQLFAYRRLSELLPITLCMTVGLLLLLGPLPIFEPCNLANNLCNLLPSQLRYPREELTKKPTPIVYSINFDIEHGMCDLWAPREFVCALCVSPIAMFLMNKQCKSHFWAKWYTSTTSIIGRRGEPPRSSGDKLFACFLPCYYSNMDTVYLYTSYTLLTYYITSYIWDARRMNTWSFVHMLA